MVVFLLTVDYAEHDCAESHEHDSEILGSCVLDAADRSLMVMSSTVPWEYSCVNAFVERMGCFTHCKPESSLK